MFIYKIVNLNNNKLYIGKTIGDIQSRLKKHFHNALSENRQSRLYSAIRKYGRTSFTSEIIEICDTVEKLNQREIFWISSLNTNDPTIGYNMTKGGDGGHTAGTATLIQQAKERKGKTAEQIYGTEKAAAKKIKQAKSMIGKLVGRNFSEETIEKMSKTQKRKLENPIYKSKLIEQISNVSKERTGTKRPNLHSQTTKNYLGDLRRGKTYEELYGAEKARIAIERQSLVRCGAKNHLWKELPIREIIQELINDPYINTGLLAKKYNCSRQTFTKKLRSITKIENLQKFRFDHSKDEIILFFKKLVDEM